MPLPHLSSPRTRLIGLLVAVSVIGSGGLVAAVTTGSGSGADRAFRACPPGVSTFQLDAGDPLACVHEDVPPPGVDVTEHVSTAELLERDGNGPKAAAAAEEAGLPVPAAATTPSRTVDCDGDGTSGYRVQAVYVYDPTKPAQTGSWSSNESYAYTGSTGGDRFTLVKPKIQEWAAGVDTTFKLSAALTGGARSVRWVTEPDGQGGCVPTVLQVASSTISENGLSALPADMKAKGLGAANRKYLMWADASVLCGIGSVYSSSFQPDQGNPNNGLYASYSRVDTGCWGLQHTEAHELTHNLGAVLSNAPHKSAAGHCTDESDLMCYSDGSGVTMKNVCPEVDEALLDCNGDDYFNTFPKPGSYLTTTWNAANSRFLLGGGDGTTGGATGTNRAEVFGVDGITALPTQVSATAVTPSGRTHTTAFSTRTWGCATSGGSGDQGRLGCRPGIASASVTAVVTDSAGVKSEASTLVSFDQAARPATLTITTPSVSGCVTRPTITGDLRDTSTGTGVYGATVTFRQGGTTIGSGRTDLDGHLSAQVSASGTSPITAAVSDTAYASATVTGQTTVTGTCTVTAVTATADELHPYFGGSVSVIGSATNGTSPAAGVPVTVSLGDASASTTTDAEGGFEVTLSDLRSGGTITVMADGVGPFSSDTIDLLPVASSVTATNTGAMAGKTSVVSGVVKLSDPTTGQQRVVSGIPVAVAGTGWSLTSTPTNAQGVYSVTTPALAATQQVQARVTGQVGLADSSATTVITVADRTSSISLSAPASALLGTTPTVTGTLSLTDGSGPVDASGRTVRVVSTSGGTSTTSTGTTTAGGGFSVTLPAMTGTTTVVANFDASSPWPAAASGTATVSATKPVFATTLVVDTTPTSVLTGADAVVGGTFGVRDLSNAVVDPTGAVIAVTSTQSGKTAATTNVVVGSNGRWNATLSGLTATTTFTARFLGSSTSSSTWAATPATASRTIAIVVPTYTTATAITSAPTSVLYGSRATVAGTLKVTASAGPVPSAGGKTVRIVVTPSGLAATTLYATTTSTGTWSVSTPAITRSTTVSAYFDKSGSWSASPAATRTIASTNYAGTPVVSSSTPKLIGPGTATLTGVAYKASGTTKWALPGARVTVSNYDAAGLLRTRTTVTADSTGKFTAKLTVTYTGTLRVSQAAATGVNAGVATNRAVVVAFKPAISLSTKTPRYGTGITAYTTLSPARKNITATLQRYAGGKWISYTAIRTDAYGKAKLTVKASAKGTVKYRWYITGDKYNAAAYSATLTTTVS